MKRIFPPYILILLCALTSFSQTPTPKPAEDNDVVKISTTLVQVDVSVTDRKGNVVKDLKAEDFEIYENGKKQEITNFSFVAGGGQSPTKPPSNQRRTAAALR